MKIRTLELTVLCICLLSFRAAATTYYVDIDSTNPTAPFISWSTAATNIQDAISETVSGDLVLVNPGLYQNGGATAPDQSSYRVMITNAITVESASGSTATYIDGDTEWSTANCAYLVNGATLSGFTAINSITYPGSGNITAVSTNAVITNCVFAQGEIINSGTLNSCLLLGCYCINSTMNSCVISNTAEVLGGVLNNCIFVNYTNSEDNVATAAAGYPLSLNNCMISNCACGDAPVYNEDTGDYTNCILNKGGDVASSLPSTLNNCCATPALLTQSSFRNITNAPIFVNLAGGDFHLQSSSPSINSGNNAYVSSATDLDGNPRIVGGTVDMGAYEYQTPTSIISYAYLQQYGLPTDGSVDFADLDGTAFNVYQDWIAGLDPTNPASVLAMLTPVVTTNATGVTVTWQSVSGIPYILQRSTNLTSQPPFSTIQNNITGQSNTTSCTDTSATNNVPYFYRVGVIAP